MKITEINGVVVDDLPLRTARVIEPCRKHRVPGNRERGGGKEEEKIGDRSFRIFRFGPLFGGRNGGGM